MRRRISKWICVRQTAYPLTCVQIARRVLGASAETEDIAGVVVKDRYAEGLAVRRTVMGDAHVDRALARVDDLSADIQQLITEVGWGMVWTRPGLSLRDRSLVNIAMLSGLGRMEELRHHTIGALRNGLTRDELREVILQSAIYCGFPAAQTALRAVREALREVEEHPEVLSTKPSEKKD